MATTRSTQSPPRQAIVLKGWTLVLTTVFMLGCSTWPPKDMYAPTNVPTDRATIDPWISSLLNVDVSTATRIVKDRLKSEDPRLAPIVKRMSEFTPCKIAFTSELGHVRCVRPYVDASTNQTQYDALYLVQPLSTEQLQKRVDYFEDALRPTMSAFLQRFAGSGEELNGTAGQFAYDSWPTAREFGYSDESNLGTWTDATLLYLCLNGDAVFIKPDGATAWRVLETDETIPLASTFEEFIKLYASFRATPEVFDSWAYRDFMAGKARL